MCQIVSVKNKTHFYYSDHALPLWEFQNKDLVLVTEYDLLAQIYIQFWK